MNNKLITKKIKSIESELTATNAVIQRALAVEPTWDYDDACAVQELEKSRDALDVALEFEIRNAPEEISRDVMPAEAALEMLCDPKAKLSARMRKNCSDARATYYQSVRERKPGAVKLASRLQTAKLTQLGKWLRRAAARSAGNTKQLRKLDGIDNPKANMIREMLCVRGINLEISRAALRAELATRV
jgi:hypothetical protein